MKILILSYTDSYGGAALGARRLAEGLVKKGIDVTLGVAEKTSDASFVKDFSKNKGLLKNKNIRKLLLRIEYFLLDKIFKSSNSALHSLNLYSIIDVRKINKEKYDLVNLHWICHNTISVKDIKKVKSPIIWTMHDCWPACGAEHYPNILENDRRYTQKYTKTNRPETTKGIDLCKLIWKQKYRYLHNSNIDFTAPSHWQSKILMDSYIFRRKYCETIPNLIDHNIFKPLSKSEKNALRKSFGLEPNKITLCFGACSLNSSKTAIKGTWYLVEALKKLENKDAYQLVIFGQEQSNFATTTGLKTLFTGFQSCEKILSKLYGMCDIFICPSIIENLPYTCLESICTGLAITSFNEGGVSDIVEHKSNGYLAKCYDVDDLKNGIIYCSENLDFLQMNSLKKAKCDFDYEKTLEKYVELYKNKILNWQR